MYGGGGRDELQGDALHFGSHLAQLFFVLVRVSIRALAPSSASGGRLGARTRFCLCQPLLYLLPHPDCGCKELRHHGGDAGKVGYVRTRHRRRENARERESKREREREREKERERERERGREGERDTQERERQTDRERNLRKFRLKGRFLFGHLLQPPLELGRLFPIAQVHVCVCVCLCVRVYRHVYIERGRAGKGERTRERDREGGREGERGRGRARARARARARE